MGTPLALYVPFCMICGTPTSSIRVSLDPLGIVVLDTTKFDAFMCTVVPPPPASVVGVFPAFPVGVVPGRVQAANRMLPNANTTIDIVRNPNRFVLMTLIPLITIFLLFISFFLFPALKRRATWQQQAPTFPWALCTCTTIFYCNANTQVPIVHRAFFGMNASLSNILFHIIERG